MFPMYNMLLWNIRGMKSQEAFERLKLLQQQHILPFIALHEPMVRSTQIERYRQYLGMQHY